VHPGPTTLLLVRHGESVGNVAATAADRAGAEVVDIDTRDADTPLSERGAKQARALGTWLGALGPDDTPQAVWCSPYLRARQTARHALDVAGLDLRVHTDERLRDRELGVLDRLTGTGVRRRLPDEAARRALLGKMYHRPPGGESWADVALRLRTLVPDLERREDGRRVLVVAHDAVVLLLRYVLEDLTEDELMDVVRSGSVRNASVTRLDRADDAWSLALFDEVGHLEALDAPVTEHEGTDDARV